MAAIAIASVVKAANNMVILRFISTPEGIYLCTKEMDKSRRDLNTVSKFGGRFQMVEGREPWVLGLGSRVIEGRGASECFG